ncbi:MAG: SUMF1/EgtB/PvdO family nonheme iron enzyme [Pseudomonadota bacterium]
MKRVLLAGGTGLVGGAVLDMLDRGDSSIAVASLAAIALKTVEIPAGSFMMGCVPLDTQCEPSELPRHEVTIQQGFRIAQTETTIGEYREFTRATGYRTLAELEGVGRYWDTDTGEWKWIAGLTWELPYDRNELGEDKWPAVQVSWQDAAAFCGWTGGRLPTEAEWEYAARGGRDGEIYFWGNQSLPLDNGVRPINAPDEAAKRLFPQFNTISNYDDGFARAAPVASFTPNGYGLYDVAGNVYEWTADWMAEEPYSEASVTDPKGLPIGSVKALRSGGWGYPPEQMRLSFRGYSEPKFWTATFGFRCAWSNKAD